MKTLILLRHAKSAWGDPGVPDRDRPLTGRGKRAARRMGRFLADVGLPPDLVLASPAVRARDTAALAAAAGGWSAVQRQEPAIYDATSRDLLALVGGLDEGPQVVLLTGHEPGFSELVGALVGGARVHFPTAAMARIDLSVDAWSLVGPDCGTLCWLVAPKLLERAGQPASRD